MGAVLSCFSSLNFLVFFRIITSHLRKKNHLMEPNLKLNLQISYLFFNPLTNYYIIKEWDAN